MWLDAKNSFSIARAQAAKPLALRVKSIIDQSFQNPKSLSTIAQQLRTNPESISRSFRSSFGLNLVEYRTWLRVMVATQALLKEKSITDVFQDVGYQDLGRFYKQFRHVTTVPPGRYSKRKSKNAKK